MYIYLFNHIKTKIMITARARRLRALTYQNFHQGFFSTGISLTGSSLFSSSLGFSSVDSSFFSSSDIFQTFTLAWGASLLKGYECARGSRIPASVPSLHDHVQEFRLEHMEGLRLPFRDEDPDQYYLPQAIPCLQI